jgi:hypothetical protein
VLSGAGMGSGGEGNTSGSRVGDGRPGGGAVGRGSVSSEWSLMGLVIADRAS